jgi:hypothetical protein
MEWKIPEAGPSFSTSLNSRLAEKDVLSDPRIKTADMRATPVPEFIPSKSETLL